MKYHVILAAALCSVAGVVSAASFCNGATQVPDFSQVCKANADTEAEGMLIIAGLTNVRNGAMPELLTYLQTLRDLDGTPARVRSRAGTGRTLTGLMEVRPVQFFDNLVVLVVSTAVLRSRDGNLSVFLSDYEKELNKKLKDLSGVKLSDDQEFRVNIKKITTARLEVSQRLNSNSADPNDPLFSSEQWSLREKGIKAEAAWARLAMIPDSQLPTVTVAVIDQNINPHHAELKDTGMNDGCDLTIQTQQPSECPPVQSNTSGHGTSVAGVIAAASHNSKEVAGATYRGLGRGNIAKILPVQMDFSSQCTSALFSALKFAVDPEQETKNVAGLWDFENNGPSGGQYKPVKGAKVINMSFSFDSCSESTGRLMDRIAHHFPDVLLVNAVKNDHRDLNKEDEVVREYPASYKQPTSPAFDNLLTVTYSDQYRSIHGNYGNTSVDIAAPGTNDLPFLASDRPGSSFAAPLVSSAAAVLKSLAPTWGFARIREYIMESRNPDIELDSDEEWSNGGLLDMDAATKAPVKFAESDDGSITNGTVWTVSTPQRINWKRTFKPQVGANVLCSTLKLEAQYQNDAGSWPMNWTSLVAGTVNTVNSGTTGGKTVTVPSWGLQSGEKRSARVRLRCNLTQLFTVSEIFTVEKN